MLPQPHHKRRRLAAKLRFHPPWRAPLNRIQLGKAPKMLLHFGVKDEHRGPSAVRPLLLRANPDGFVQKPASQTAFHEDEINPAPPLAPCPSGPYVRVQDMPVRRNVSTDSGAIECALSLVVL